MFCQAFGSKRELFLSCLERYQKVTALDLTTRLEGAASGREFIGGVNPMGCLVVNTATEFAQRDGGVAAHVSQGFDNFRAIFLKAAERGQQDGTVRTDKESDVLANCLVTSMSGLRTMVKAGTDLEMLRGTVAMVTSAL